MKRLILVILVIVLLLIYLIKAPYFDTYYEENANGWIFRQCWEGKCVESKGNY